MKFFTISMLWWPMVMFDPRSLCLCWFLEVIMSFFLLPLTLSTTEFAVFSITTNFSMTSYVVLPMTSKSSAYASICRFVVYYVLMLADFIIISSRMLKKMHDSASPCGKPLIVCCFEMFHCDAIWTSSLIVFEIKDCSFNLFQRW